MQEVRVCVEWSQRSVLPPRTVLTDELLQIGFISRVGCCDGTSFFCDYDGERRTPYYGGGADAGLFAGRD